MREPILTRASAGHLLLAAWMAVVVVWYGHTAMGAVRQVPIEGAEVKWGLVWLAVVALAAASSWLSPGRGLTFLWLGATGSTGLMILVRSQSVTSAAVALWILGVAAGCGLLVLRLCGIRGVDDAPTRLALCVSIGLAVVGEVMFVLAALGFSTAPAVLAALGSLSVAALLPAVSWLRRTGRDGAPWPRVGDPDRELPPPSFEKAVGRGIMSAVFLLNLCWAVAPEIQYDGLSYHLAVPKIYLQHHGLLNLPNFFHSYFAHLIEMVFLPCLALSGPVAAKLVMLGVGLAGAAAVQALGAITFDPRVGRWAALLFYTTPTVSLLSGSTHIDLAAALFVTATFIAFSRWRAPAEPGWLYVTAILAGAALAVKVNSAYGVLVPGVAVLASLLARAAVRQLVLASLVFLAVAGPWFAVVHAWTGNPVFPLYNGVFKSPLWDPGNVLMNAADFGLGTSVPALLQLPFRLTYDTSRFGEGQPGGGAGLALLLALPWLVFGLFRQSTTVRFLLATCAVSLALWAATFQYVRYYVLILPMVSVLAAAAARRTVAALLAAVLLQVLVIPALFWQIPERFPIGVALGWESRDSFLARAVPGYRLALYLNRVVPPNGRVLGDMESVRYYLDPPLDTLSDSLLNSPLRVLGDVAPEALADRLADLGYTHLFVYRESLTDPPSYLPHLSPAFLRDHAVLEASDDGACVFRLERPRVPSAAEP